jgi:hypothetical protein
MNTEPAGSSDTPESTPEDRTFDNIVTALNRGEALLKIVGDFSAAALQKLEVFNLSQLGNPDTLMAMDIYDRSLTEVTDLLDSKGIKFDRTKQVTEVADEEAHTLQNLGTMAWKVPSGSNVELLINRERVVGIRVLGEQKK